MMITIIEKLRKEKAFTQQTIADKIGITRQTFSKMEKGEIEPSLGQAVKLAELFGVEIEQFLPSDTQVMSKKGIDWDKYKQIITNFIHYGADSDGKITKTKLAKLCYLLDFAWYYFNLDSITGLEYRRNRQGPVPDAYFSTIEELQQEESIFVEVKGKTNLIGNIGNPQDNLLSEDEKELLKKIAEKWQGKNTQEIVDFTHNQLPWMICHDKEIIPYGLISQEELENVY